MKTSISLKWIRLAALAAVSVLPGMAACTYSASPNSPTLGPSGGYVSVTVYTQPGCRWSITKNAAWLSSSNYGVGSGTIYIAAASTRSARSGIVRVYPDYVAGELSLSDGSIGGRSSVTGGVMRAILQFYVIEN
jgi:hypothetical protein